MRKFFYNKFIIYSSIVIVAFLLDRVSKNYILGFAEANGEVNIYINSFLNLILVWNNGIGFGLFPTDSVSYYNLFTILIVLINLIIIYMMLNSDYLRGFIFSIILGGSFGNLFDRFYYSAVPDFIDLNYNNFHWFIFNVADIFISIGITCLIFVEIFSNKIDSKYEK